MYLWAWSGGRAHLFRSGAGAGTPPGTILDLLNALLRAHGELVWEYKPGDPEVVAATGLPHQLTLGTFGGAGAGVPVR